MPSTPLSMRSAPSRSISSASILRTTTRGVVGDAGMIERLVDRFVGVVVLDVLADDGDGDLVGRVLHLLQHLRASRSMSSGLASQAQLLDDQLVELVVRPG